jgi:phospholipase/carboxylesterase
MATTQAGIHHTTGITGDAQANIDFYADLLGLRLVKRTVSHNDKTALHLFYGDGNGTPGTLLSFFAWPDTARGRRGVGQATEIGLAVPQQNIGDWVQRLLSKGVTFSGPTPLGETSMLAFEDPDGLPIVIVGVLNAPAGEPWAASTVSTAMQIRGIHHVTFWTERIDETGRVLEQHLGLRRVDDLSGMRRYHTDAAIGHTVLVRDASGFWPSAGGVGTLHHVAFRARDLEHEQSILAGVQRDGLDVSEVREHGYFQSIYFREPGGNLLEVATDTPGFTLDEAAEELGRSLTLPPEWEAERQDIEVTLPHIALPGEPRRATRDLGWVHRYIPGGDALTLLLLHGSGGNETSLLSFGRRVAPEANLLAVRGRSLDEGSPRFFRRFGPLTYDQDDLMHEADALALFVHDAAGFYGFDRDRLVALGYSNGANIALASLAFNPDVYGGAVLLRPVMVLEHLPVADVKGLPVLVVHGRQDSFVSHAGPVAPYLRRSGAEVREETLNADHQLGEQDRAVVAQWLPNLEPR